jgi:chromosomal replication initiation ATPase DnaA
MYACRKIEALVESDPAVRREVAEIRSRLTS